MAMMSKRPGTGLRRVWRVPATSARWYWLAASIALYGALYIWYSYALRTQDYPGPLNDPLRLFGIIAFGLVLGTGSYTLRRRFVRALPGKVQNWLWMHIWLGISTILIAFLHDNYAYITHDYCQNLNCLTDTYWAPSALYSLVFLVISGITGRLLDSWQTRLIAHEASSNGVGIVGALEARITELEYTIERLCAGKSATFKQFCQSALQSGQPLLKLTEAIHPIGVAERVDFQRSYEIIIQRSALVISLHKQRRARQIMKIWRTVHMVLASLAVVIISYHAIMELLANVWHIITPQ
ncbi:hypothetical protein [Tengunoibacter tsumagoiensis]|uniref:Uncharacterized protein n=1 Tax=Tengunoibacter tsumagoiensis TaxID=2014871 RepID=A0A401ZVK6_9CHLR|nr:hypothetical protein [Tengunoibacter tsumagoiensis]GCE10780.1 hypothetical protein KTT_06390 [Tengunoibacter tsumagoiensis]